MMTNSSVLKARTLRWWSALVLGLGLGCQDEDPCDPGQEERGAASCYPLPAAGAAGTQGQAGTDGAAGTEDPGEGTDAGGADEVQAAVGDPCTDTAAHSDCGGDAPICAPFPGPNGARCTQISCEDGEVNAGACPATAPCIRPPPPNDTTSLCFPM
jgi:hypothetical protein